MIHKMEINDIQRYDMIPSTPLLLTHALSTKCVRHTPQSNVTVRLTFLTQSFRMKSTLQGLTWFECCEISQ
jgi:hypothetical protein